MFIAPVKRPEALAGKGGFAFGLILVMVLVAQLIMQ